MHPIPQGHGRTLRVAGVVLALLVLLAVVAVASRSGFGHTSNAGATPAYVSWAMSIFIVVFAAMTPVAIYVQLLQTRERLDQRGHQSYRARLVRGLGVLALVLFVFWARVYLRHHHALPSINAFWLQHGSNQKAMAGADRHYNPTFQWPVLWVALVLLAGVVAWYLWARAHRRDEAAAAAAPSIENDVAASISDAIADLQAEPDARRAVVAAYARMEGAFARHGLQRRVSETPTEYLRRLLLGLTSQADAVRRLTSLFEQAKFSAHTIDGAMKDDAIAALRLIRDDLSGAAA